MTQRDQDGPPPLKPTEPPRPTGPTEAPDPAGAQAGLQALLAGMGSAVIFTDAQGRITFMNADAAELTGWDAAAARGHAYASVLSMADLDSRAALDCRLDAVLQGKETPPRQAVLIGKNGTAVPVEERAVALRDTTVEFTGAAPGTAATVTGAAFVFRDITDYIRVRDALRHSESRKAAILDASLDAIITMDHEGNIVDFNATAETLFGYRRERAVGQAVADLLIPGRLRSQHAEGLARHLASGTSSLMGRRVELPALRADGSEFTAELSVSRIQDADPPLFTATLRDLTQARAAHVTQTRLAAIVETSDDAIISKTLDGIVTSWNKGAERIFGHSAAEMLGRNIRTVIPPERYGEEDFILRQLRGGTSVGHFETVRVTSSGARIDVSLSTSPILDAEGRIVGGAKIVRDITVKKRSEAALRQQTRNLELLNRTGALLSSKLDLKTLTQAVTDAATEICGARFGAFFYNTTDENGDAYLLYTLCGAPLEAFAKFGNPRATALFGPTFAGGPPIRCDDVLADPRYGKFAPHHGMPKGHLPVRSYLAVPVKTRTGEVIGGLFFGHPEVKMFTQRNEEIIVSIATQAAIAMDNARLYEAAQKAAAERAALLDSERAARAEAERTSEIKDQFLATLSHELRTPLNAVLGWAQVLSRGQRSEADLLKGLETIERNARAQAKLIEDLLDMSRITSGKLRLDVQRVEPVLFIEAAIETVRHAAEAKGVRLTRALDSAACEVSGDQNRLQQMVWNLLSNAIKFTPAGGTVEVALRRDAAHVVISVSDTGAGIEPAFLDHVFDRFRQGDASLTRRHGGLGLGLAIVKSLTELHGGTVRAESPGPQQGSVFEIRLPALAERRRGEARPSPAQAADALSAEEASSLDLTGMKVLVVDDERDALDLTRRILSDRNAEVYTAEFATEALRLVESEKPHILVSDIGMPEVDGYELLKRVRALGGERGGRLPAIALTAFARRDDRTRALHAGFAAHLVKPLNPNELVAAVAAIGGPGGPTSAPSAGGPVGGGNDEGAGT